MHEMQGKENNVIFRLVKTFSVNTTSKISTMQLNEVISSNKSTTGRKNAEPEKNSSH